MAETTAKPNQPFPPRVEAYFQQALPAGKSGHALLLGEGHDYPTHLRILKEKWDRFGNPKGYNVGTLAREFPTYLNVLFWAKKDGKLPVTAGQENQYIEQMMRHHSPEKLKATTEEAGRLMNRATDTGGTVLFYDARSLWADELAQNGQNMDHMRSHYGAFVQEFRQDPTAFQQRVQRERRIIVKPPEGVLKLMALIDIQDILAKNPDYFVRLSTLEETARRARQRGLPEDAQSAAIIKANADKTKNVLVIPGAAHLMGLNQAKIRMQGTLAEHLRLNGFKVTGARVITSYDQLILMDGSPGKDGEEDGENYPEYVHDCSAQAPMTLVFLDQDIVLDVSNRYAIRAAARNKNSSAEAKEFAKAILQSGARLTCDQMDLPPIAQCAKWEVEGKGSCLPPTPLPSEMRRPKRGESP